MIARIALGVIVALAQATEPTGTLTLACQGTTQWSDDAKPVPTATGIIIDFAARTIEGFGRDVSFPIRITTVTETTITFSGNNWDGPKKPVMFSIDGTIDRVTGAVEAVFVGVMEKRDWGATYVLQCKPTQRMF